MPRLPKLSASEWLDAQKRHARGESKRQIAKTYNVSEAAIRRMLAAPVDSSHSNLVTLTIKVRDSEVSQISNFLIYLRRLESDRRKADLLHDSYVARTLKMPRADISQELIGLKREQISTKRALRELIELTKELKNEH